MLQNIRYRRQGFTLVELAIVLAIAGLLFVGLWRLLSGGNQQLRDQAAASQIQQLIDAVKNYLSADPDGFLRNTVPQAGVGARLRLPTSNLNNADCRNNTAGTTNDGICNYLPAGFVGEGANSTTNSYGQTYFVRVIRNDNSLTGTMPSAYSFMIITQGGDTIPDTSGGRISALIGGDGGFIYGSDVCGTPVNTRACGSYGGWAVSVTNSAPTGYGFGGSAATGFYAVGHIATRTYASPATASDDVWLARGIYTGDSAANNWLHNTMTTHLYMGRNGGGVAQNIYMAPLIGGVQQISSGGSINMDGGTIFMKDSSVIGNTYSGAANIGNIWMQGGSIFMGAFANNGGGSIALQGGQLNNISDTNHTGGISLVVNAPTQWITPANPMVNLATGCTVTSTNPFLAFNAACQPGISVTGDIRVTGRITAYDFYSVGFIYNPSDIRFKRNIRDLKNPLQDLMRLKPVIYTAKPTDRESLGVIAQDVEKIYPQLVSENGGMKAVAYDGLIAPLIGAVQELKKENDQLRRELDEQKLRQQKLEDKLYRGAGL